MPNERSTAPTLIVEGGVHREARASLKAGPNRAGAAPDNDIVLFDLGPAKTPFALNYRGGAVVLHAVDAPVELSGRKILAVGTSKRCSDGLRFTSGGIPFRLELASPKLNRPAQPVRFRLRSYLPVLTGGLLCTALLGLVASLNLAPSVEASGISSETTGSIPATAVQSASESGQQLAATLQGLRQHLAGSGLDSIALSSEPDGSIEARGQIMPQQQTAWLEAGRWFDGTAGGRAVLVDQVRISAEAPPLKVQAVWPGRSPYVIDGSGDKLFIGTILPSGWTISGIDAKHVLVKRGDQTLAVRF